MFVKLSPKNREKMIKEFLNTRKTIKEQQQKEKEVKQGFEESAERLFQPITKSLNESQAKIADTEKNIVSNQKVLYKAIVTPPGQTIPAIQPPPKILVSKLIQDYLSDSEDRSTAGYSIRYNTKDKAYTIGNSKISFHNNEMNIAGKMYNATKGLMELLTKKDPDTDEIMEEDYQDYKQILNDTSAIYFNFDSKTSRLIGDRSEKWRMITDLMGLKKRGAGADVIYLPENNDELVDMLRLSMASYLAGNNGETNRVHAILDQLVKRKLLTKLQYYKILKSNAL